MKTRLFVPVRIAILSTLFAAAHLTAGNVTFAQFSEANGTNDFVFTNNGNGTGTFTATSQIDFTFFSSAIPAADLLLGRCPLVRFWLR